MLVELNSYHILEILIFFGVFLAVGIQSLFRKHSTAESYFLASRTTGWILLGLSLFSAEFLFSSLFFNSPMQAPPAYISIGLVIFSSIVLLIVAWNVIPRFFRNTHITVISFFEERYGSSVGLLISVILFVVYAIIGLSYIFLFASTAFKNIFGWEIKMYGIIIVLLVGMFAIIGGYHTVIRLQALSAIGMLSSALFLIFKGVNPLQLFSIVGVNEVTSSGISWFCSAVLLFWLWGFDQYIVQHMVSAKNEQEMKKGVVFVVLLRIVVVIFILAVSTMLVYGHFQYEGSSDEIISATTVFSVSMIIAVLLGLINSAATILSVNILARFYPSVAGHKAVLIGRLTTTSMVVVAILCILIVRLFTTEELQLFQMLSIISVMPCAAVVVAGLIYKKTFLEGAFLSIAAGILIGLLLLLSQKWLGEETRNVFFVSNDGIAMYSFLTSLLIFIWKNSWLESVRQYNRIRTGKQMS